MTATLEHTDTLPTWDEITAMLNSASDDAQTERALALMDAREAFDAAPVAPAPVAPAPVVAAKPARVAKPAKPAKTAAPSDREAELAAMRAHVNDQRKPAERIGACVRRLYLDQLIGWAAEAETATRGHMLSPAGLRAGIEPSLLFDGSAKVAAKYASDELKEWWENGGANYRMTLVEYRAQMLGRPTDVRDACAARIQSSEAYAR